MKKPSYRKLKQMLESAETAFRQMQGHALNQGSELVQLRETVKKLSNDLEHKDRSLREAHERVWCDSAKQQAELLKYAAVNEQAESKVRTLEVHVKELEAKLEAVRLVIR